MAVQKTTTVRLNARTLKRVDGLARAMSRSRNSVISDAVEKYLDYEEWFAREVHKGLKEARAGRVVDHDAVVAEWERKLAPKMDPGRGT